MYIERIEQLEKGRRRLVFETGERLVLYKGEIRSYDLSEGQDISETLYCVRTNIRKKQWSRRSPMSRVITILMICVMPAAMSVIRKRRRAIADFSRIYRRKGLQKSSSNRHF